jgi:hypothetical protein
MVAAVQLTLDTPKDKVDEFCSVPLPDGCSAVTVWLHELSTT